MFKLALVLRYLRKRTITIFPVAGVALGVMALVVVMSVMEGFETDFRARIRGIMPDMTLEFRDVYGFSGNVDELTAKIAAVKEVAAVSPYISGLALGVAKTPAPDGIHEYVNNITVTFKGFDYAREAAVLPLAEHLKYGGEYFKEHPDAGAGEDTVFIGGARLAGAAFPGVRTPTTDWGALDRGMRVQLLTFTPEYERSKIVGRVEDIVSTGLNTLDETLLFMPIEKARLFRSIPENTISGVSIALVKYDDETIAAAKTHIREALSDVSMWNDYSLKTWEESRRTFLMAVYMERRMMAFILFFFLVVAGFAISAILVMIVLEKIRDIGILRAMGASARGVAGIFLVYGLTIGLIGAAIGLGIGVIFVENLDVIEQFIYAHTGWQPFPPDVYDLPAIPRILNWWTNLYIVSTALLVSFFASVLPAVRAAWLDPVEAIRYE